MLSPIVLRLQELQKPNLYEISMGSYEILRIYLIGICNDTPANSIVQNQLQPNGVFGCSKCEIPDYCLPFRLFEQQKSYYFVGFLRIYNTSKISCIAFHIKRDNYYLCSNFSDTARRQIEVRSNTR